MRLILLFFSCIIFCSNCLKAQPFDLKCEYHKEPVNIDKKNPMFSWKFHSEKRNWIQSAFQLYVATSKELLEKNKPDLWNSGKISYGKSNYIKYAGKQLKSYLDCWWKVKVWDKEGNESNWSGPAFFKTSIIEKNDWKAKWIGSDLELMDYQKKLREYQDFGMEPETEIWGIAKSLREMVKDVDYAPAVYLRKEFVIKKQIRKAIASVCGLGLFEFYINGNKIGNQFLDPAPSDYQKRIFYVNFDITNNLKAGANAFGVILGNGWYNLIIPHVLRYYAADYIDPPKLLLQALVEYTDGSREMIFSDKDWKYTTDGPITFNCLLGGETYDARKEMKDWSKNGFNDENWKQAKYVKSPEGKLYAQQIPPVKIMEEFPAKKIEKIENGYQVDLGKEIVGWARVRLKGKAGQKIEVSYPGKQSHTLGRYQTCYFILKGNEIEIFESKFCYNGFRYIDIKGIDYQPELDDITGLQVCSALEKTGEFSCSNDKLTALQNILIHTIRNYILHIPNDPTREKAGWTQDVENGFDVNAYNFDCLTMYLKWQDDFLDIQHENGYVPPVAPGRFDGPTINGPWWGGMIVYNPWKIYQYFGDEEVLKKSYPAIKKYLGYLSSISEKNIIKWGLGDWLEPGTVRPKITPIPLTSTCGYYLFVNIAKEAALLLNKKEDAKNYEKMAHKIKDAYNSEFLKDGVYALGSQASQMMSLYFGLAPDEKRDLIIEKLIERISLDSNHINTGFVSTPMLLMSLSELGYADLAYKIATQNTYPSWFDMVFNKGNTVFKESWDGGLVQMPSLGGALGAWFFHTLGGIRTDPSAPGFKKIIIAPEIIGDLKWVKSEISTIYGKIISNWETFQDKYFFLNLDIPENTTAKVFLPGSNPQKMFEGDEPIQNSRDIKISCVTGNKTALEIGSGTYKFKVEYR